MPKNNPVRAQYAFIGTLQLVGIRNISGMTFIAAEGSTTSLSVQDPSSVLWLTQRSLNHSMREHKRKERNAGRDYDIDPDNPVITQGLLDELKRDPKVAKRTTEDMIVHMCGGETPANRAYAQAQIQALNEFYLAGSTVVAA
jgi:hypothetical protein